MQQDPSPGQSASVSMLSQKRAYRPLVHSPLHGFLKVGFGLVCIVVVLVVVAIAVDGCLVDVHVVLVVVVVAIDGFVE